MRHAYNLKLIIISSDTVYGKSHSWRESPRVNFGTGGSVRTDTGGHENRLVLSYEIARYLSKTISLHFMGPAFHHDEDASFSLPRDVSRWILSSIYDPAKR
jgi:hypothetical protein